MIPFANVCAMMMFLLRVHTPLDRFCGAELFLLALKPGSFILFDSIFNNHHPTEQGET